jgi:hypothetical protein
VSRPAHSGTPPGRAADLGGGGPALVPAPPPGSSGLRWRGRRACWSCPACGWPSHKDKDAQQAGWCPRCGHYSGRCPVGWQIASTELGVQSWQFACLDPGTPGCEYSYTFPGGQVLRVRLCAGHAAQVASGAAPPLPGLLRPATRP